MERAFGIIGCGNTSRFRFDGLARAGAKVVHVAELNERAARPRGTPCGARARRALDIDWGGIDWGGID